MDLNLEEFLAATSDLEDDYPVELGLMRQAMRELVAARQVLPQVAAEVRLARAAIHQLTWGRIVITDHPELRETLKAWGKFEKVPTPVLNTLVTPP